MARKIFYLLIYENFDEFSQIGYIEYNQYIDNDSKALFLVFNTDRLYSVKKTGSGR